MTNGLKYENKKPYAEHLQKMLGMALPPLRLDEIQVVLRCHMIFRMTQVTWLERTKTNHKFLELTNDMELNLMNGGMCLVFDLIDEVRIAFKELPEMQERIVTSIKPDILMKKCDDRANVEL